nr:unnamed protein product [Callosobruchus chinensis]
MSLNSAVCTFHNSGYNSKFSIKRHVSSLVQLNFSILNTTCCKTFGTVSKCLRQTNFLRVVVYTTSSQRVSNIWDVIINTDLPPLTIRRSPYVTVKNSRCKGFFKRTVRKDLTYACVSTADIKNVWRWA